ncbi:hypothetical protein NERG_01202 [Nematocida ausubeli]|uniref:SEP domain-containing protein n=1 Tax=Nematocida ausubeli (strain ATCC PRA-371 / ERTm2) TaxID=1913371 RepID=H8ZBV9_NEMA1|nr:hypothetical protein NERG_01202 [Nematocida ausubeli]KAI5135624.1 hypothetical protein NEAUS06_1569 [Nematocida ausubeli]
MTGKIAELVKKLNCTENQARNALQLARDDMAIAETIIKEYNADKRTSYVGGHSGQIVEIPKTKYAAEFEKLMKASNAGENEEAVGSRKLTIYKNGFMIDDKFTPLSEKEIKRALDNILKKQEVPSDLFNIKQNDLVDVEIQDKSDEVYKEDYPGLSRTVKLTIPQEGKSVIELGTDEVLFKLTIRNKNTIVKMGGCTSFAPLQKYLQERECPGGLFHDGKNVPWEENPSKYKRELLKLVE